MKVDNDLPGATFTGPNIRHIISSSTPLPSENVPSAIFVFEAFNEFCKVMTLLVEALYGMEFVVEHAASIKVAPMTAALSSGFGERMNIPLVKYTMGA